MRSVMFFGTEHEATTNWRPEPFDAVSEGVVEIHACFEEVRSSADKLRRTVAWSARVQRSLEALNARCLSQLQRLEKESLPEASENLSAWLQDTLCLTPAAADSQLNNACKLEQLPTTAAAFGTGDLSAQQASVICQAVAQSHRTCLDPSAVEESLISAGKMLDPQQLLELWFQMRYEADREAGAESRAEAAGAAARLPPADLGRQLCAGRLAGCREWLHPEDRPRQPDEEALPGRHANARSAAGGCPDRAGSAGAGLW